VNYIEVMQQRNIATASQLLEFSEIVASRRLAELLKIEIGNPIYRVDILRFANRVPVILERVFFPRVRFPELEEWDLEKSSIHDLLTTVYKVKLGRISQTVEAVAAADAVAQQLRIEENSPLLMLSRAIYQKDTEEPVVFSQDFLRSDYARIHSDIQTEELGRAGDVSGSGKEDAILQANHP
jgi:GntR family transcriptional regulator